MVYRPASFPGRSEIVPARTFVLALDEPDPDSRRARRRGCSHGHFRGHAGAGKRALAMPDVPKGGRPFLLRLISAQPPRTKRQRQPCQRHPGKTISTERHFDSRRTGAFRDDQVCDRANKREVAGRRRTHRDHPTAASPLVKSVASSPPPKANDRAYTIKPQPMLRAGQQQKSSPRAFDVCFSPDNGLVADLSGGPLCATNGHRRVRRFSTQTLILRRGRIRRLKNYVADSRVRRRHRVEPINFIDMIIVRAAHDKPHDHFNPRGASLTHVVKMRYSRRAKRICRQIIQKSLIPFAVDQAGAWTTNQVRARKALLSYARSA